MGAIGVRKVRWGRRDPSCPHRRGLSRPRRRGPARRGGPPKRDGTPGRKAAADEGATKKTVGRREETVGKKIGREICWPNRYR
jgi:hypothetical protein